MYVIYLDFKDFVTGLDPVNKEGEKSENRKQMCMF